MDLYVTLDGISRLPRPYAVTYMEVNTVSFLLYCMARDSFFFYSVVAEPLYELGRPPRRYVAQRFNCSTSTDGFESQCSYNSLVDTQCFFGPHVAGVRCTESKSFVTTYHNT